jgi:beta-lactamase regulating signal transducer with metallopeptidase domain
MNLAVETFLIVFAASWRAGLLIALFLAIRPMVRRRIPAQVLYVGWIVVALRLLIPFGVPAAWSPYNLFKPIRLPASEMAPASLPVSTLAAGEIGGLASAVSAEKAPATMARTCALIWLLGVAGLLAGRVGVAWLFRRRVRCSSQIADERLQVMVRRCAFELGVAPRIAAVVTGEVQGPSLYGLVRPRLLFPIGFAGKLNDEELRLVVLHEMGHWRRRDLLAQTLLHHALILHWFNPLAWLAIRLARHDCEIACDEFVLRRCIPEATKKYGATLIKLLEAVRVPSFSPVTLGVFAGKQQLRQRIRMVAVYRAATRLRTFAGGGLLAALALVSATHESWAQDAAEAAAAAITRTVPNGWVKFGSPNAVFETGVDRTQAFHQPASAYVKALTANLHNTCGITQTCSAEAYRGQRVRFSGWVKTAHVQGSSALWLQVAHGDIHGLQSDDTGRSPVRGTANWTFHSIVLNVPPEADTINYGFYVADGTGQAWLNDPRIEIVGFDMPPTNVSAGNTDHCTSPLCPIRATQGSGPLPKAPVNFSFSVTAPH